MFKKLLLSAVAAAVLVVGAGRTARADYPYRGHHCGPHHLPPATSLYGPIGVQRPVVDPLYGVGYSSYYGSVIGVPRPYVSPGIGVGVGSGIGYGVGYGSIGYPYSSYPYTSYPYTSGYRGYPYGSGFSIHIGR